MSTGDSVTVTLESIVACLVDVSGIGEIYAGPSFLALKDETDPRLYRAESKAYGR